MAVVDLVGTTALPYSHRDRATAGLRAELRHQAAAHGAIPDWATFEVANPTEAADGRGRVWFEYRATVQIRGG